MTIIDVMLIGIIAYAIITNIKYAIKAFIAVALIVILIFWFLGCRRGRNL